MGIEHGPEVDLVGVLIVLDFGADDGCHDQPSHLVGVGIGPHRAGRLATLDEPHQKGPHAPKHEAREQAAQTSVSASALPGAGNGRI